MVSEFDPSPAAKCVPTPDPVHTLVESTVEDCRHLERDRGTAVMSQRCRMLLVYRWSMGDLQKRWRPEQEWDHVLWILMLHVWHQWCCSWTYRYTAWGEAGTLRPCHHMHFSGNWANRRGTLLTTQKNRWLHCYTHEYPRLHYSVRCIMFIMTHSMMAIRLSFPDHVWLRYFVWIQKWKCQNVMSCSCAKHVWPFLSLCLWIRVRTTLSFYNKTYGLNQYRIWWDVSHTGLSFVVTVQIQCLIS